VTAVHTGISDFMLSVLERHDPARAWTTIGAADVSCLPDGQSIAGRSGFFDCFEKTDQNVLNAAISG
jgi:hypothetical protein